MQPNLARKLIERGVIQRGTVLEAYHSAKGISGQRDTSVLGSFRLIGASATADWVYFNTEMLDTKECYKIRCDYVISLDGMPMKRIAQAQQLNEDGEELRPTSRRGKRAETQCEDYSQEVS